MYVYSFQWRPAKVYHSILEKLKTLSLHPVNQFGFKSRSLVGVRLLHSVVFIQYFPFSN
jgi:hypothetical protein